MDRENKYPVIAILTSLTMHCVVVIACCLLSDHSLPLNKHQQAPNFSVILSYLSEEGGTLPLASAVKQKAVISEEQERGTGKAINLQKGTADDILQEKMATPFVKGTGDVTGATLQEKDQSSKNLSAVGLAELPLRQRAEENAATASSGLSPYLLAGDMAAGNGRLFSGNAQRTGGGAASTGVAQGMASAGEMFYPGYAKGEAPAGGSLTIAAPHYNENNLPAYPLLARRLGYAGVAMLSVEVLADGSVGHLEMKKSSGYDLLDRSALEAVRGWKFSPAKKMGRPINMWVDVPVRFELN